MPPRYAYWTILIDNAPTAFRAADREDLQPTFVQLQRTNPNIIMKWFARGRLWNSPEEARAEAERPRVTEKRGREWRPGGEHKDPRARFDKKRKDHRPRRDNDRPPVAQDRANGHPGRDFSPAGSSPAKPGGQRPFRPGGAKPFRRDAKPSGSSGGTFRQPQGRPEHRQGSKPFRPGGAKPFRPAGSLGSPKPRSSEGGRPSGPGPRRDRRK